MVANEPLVITLGQNPTRVRVNLVGGGAVDLDIRATSAQRVELGLASPNCESLVQVEQTATPQPTKERLSPFDDTTFTQQLLECLHQAKRKAIAEVREAGLKVES